MINGLREGEYTVRVNFQKTQGAVSVTKSFKVKKGDLTSAPVSAIELVSPLAGATEPSPVCVKVKLPAGMEATTTLKARISGGKLTKPDEKTVTAAAPAFFTLGPGEYKAQVLHNDSQYNSQETAFSVVAKPLGKIKILAPHTAEELNDTNITVRWQVENAPAAIGRYVVVISGEGLDRPIKQETTGSSQGFSVPTGGDYSVTVAAKEGGVSQDSVRFSVLGSSAWIWIVLMFVMVVVAYMFLKKKPHNGYSNRPTTRSDSMPLD
jgi:hypothetical protein